MHSISEGIGGGTGGRGVNGRGGGVGEGKGMVQHKKECSEMTRSGR